MLSLEVRNENCENGCELEYLCLLRFFSKSVRNNFANREEGMTHPLRLEEAQYLSSPLPDCWAQLRNRTKAQGK